MDPSFTLGDGKKPAEFPDLGQAPINIGLGLAGTKCVSPDGDIYVSLFTCGTWFNPNVTLTLSHPGIKGFQRFVAVRDADGTVRPAPDTFCVYSASDRSKSCLPGYATASFPDPAVKNVVNLKLDFPVSTNGTLRYKIKFEANVGTASDRQPVATTIVYDPKVINKPSIVAELVLLVVTLLVVVTAAVLGIRAMRRGAGGRRSDRPLGDSADS